MRMQGGNISLSELKTKGGGVRMVGLRTEDATSQDFKEVFFSRLLANSSGALI